MLTAQTLKDSVDLLTGSVSFPVELASLPGRNGMEASLSAVYAGGGAGQNARTWNLEAGTGVLGLGWALQLDYIFVDPGRTGAPSNNRYFYVSGGTANRLVETGRSGTVVSYRAVNLQFWLISYDTASETWTVVKENGLTFSFGGGVSGSPKTSRGNSIQWAVKWDGWVGSSAVTAGQSQYALVWNLAEISNAWGDTIRYAYSAFDDDSIAVGGSGGLPYTRASYLTQITDTTGRTITLTYADKLNEASGQREYLPPHGAAINTPVAYQDRYETRYLQGLAAASESGAPLFSVDFAYQVVGEGGLAKRFLTGITRRNAVGVGLPETQFSYNTADSSAAEFGAIASVTTVEGAVVTYDYDAASPELSSRTLDVNTSDSARYKTPRFWFYADYMVAGWYDSQNKFAEFTAYSWTGRWVSEFRATLPVNDQYDAVQVLTEASFFAVYRPEYTVRSAVKPELQLCHQDPARPGRWISASFDLDELSEGEPVRLASGDRYVAVLGKTSGKVLRFSWTGTGWEKAPVITLAPGSTPKFAMAGRNNYLLLAARPYYANDEAISLQLLYLDGTGGWRTGFDDKKTSTAVNVDEIELYAGDSFAVLRVENDRTGPNDYRYETLTFTADYSDIAVADIYTSGIGEATIPEVRGALVGIGTRLWRYNGRDWSNTIDLSASAYRYPNQTGGYTMAYGFDEVVRRVEQATQDTFLGYAFDISEFYPAEQAFKVDSFNGANLPSKTEFSWSFLPVTSNTIRFPSNYVLLSSDIYYRSADGAWDKVGVIPDQVASHAAGSVQIAGSNYVSYQNGADAQIVPFHNGALMSAITLSGRSVDPGSSPKTALAGAQAFVSYTGSLSSPASLTLHRMVDKQATGLVTVPAVVAVHIADGFDTVASAYDYDLATGVAASTASVGLFNKTTKVAGVADAASAPFGGAVSYQFNGLSSDECAKPFPSGAASNADAAYGYLTGRTYRQENFAAGASEAVNTAVNYWTVTLVPLSSVAQASYARLTRTENTTDGVETAYDNAYSAQTGQLISKTTHYFDGDGAEQSVVVSYGYAANHYPAMAAANMLTLRAQETQTIGGVVYRSDVTTYADFGDGAWAPNKTYRVLTNSADFDFGAWSGASEPPGSAWLRTSKAVRRNAHGLVLEAINVDGRTVSTQYDTGARFPVAEFTNAAAYAGDAEIADGDCAYYGFEAYEAGSNWTVQAPGEVGGGDPHTGEAALKIGPSASEVEVLRAAFTPVTGDQDFVLMVWAKTAAGYGADTGEVWLELSSDKVSATARLDIPDTGQAWRYLASDGFNPGAGATLTVRAFTSKASASCVIDDIALLPAAADMTARVYDPVFRTVTAELAPGATKRSLYDDFQTLAASTGPVDNTRAINLASLARRAGSAVSPTCPNMTTTLQARGGGAYLPFTDDWAARWTATAPGAWSAQGGVLLHSGAGPDTVTWTGYAAQTSYGAMLTVAPPDGSAQPAGEVGVQTGNQTVAWRPGETGDRGAWMLNGAVVSNPNSADGSFAYARQWAIAMVDQRLLFWADGRLILDATPSVSSVGTLVLHASGSVGFGPLVVFDEPIVQIGYTDGVSNLRQELTMDAGASVVVRETLFDALSRPAIVTKPATLSVPASQPLFGYRTQFVTNGGVDGSLWTSGEMEGDINTVYPADQKHPYARDVFEASPLGRVVEKGLPGATFAVGAKSTTIGYAANTAGALPPGEYFVTTFTDADGVSGSRTVDRAGNEVASVSGTAAALEAQIETARSLTYDGQGAHIVVKTPNAFDADVADNTAFTAEQRVNYLQQLVYERDVDSGETHSIFDAAGRLHYRLTADGAGAVHGQDRVLYWRYDARGRPVEAGTTVTSFSSLPAIAPAEGQPQGVLTPRKRFRYHPANSASPGLLQEVETLPEGGGSPDVTESFTYDANGYLAGTSQSVAAYDSNAYAFAYTRDNLGNALTITYPGSPALEVVQSYNRRGLVEHIGTAASPALFAAYTYNADGSVKKEALGLNGSTGVSETFVYNSPGWLTQVNYADFLQTLLYDQASGYEGASYHTGLIASQSDNLHYSGAPAAYTYQYQYDSLGRLKVAQNTASTDWGLGTSGDGLTYDANGNLLFLNRGNDDQTYTYFDGTNRVKSLSGPDPASCTYAPAGEMLTATPRITSLTYDAFNAMPLSLAAAGGVTLNFGYNGSAERVFKQTASSSTSKTLYVRGASDYPLFELETTDGAAPVTTRYVRSPLGLIAFHTGSDLSYVVRDHLGSSRVVLDSSGAVQASYDYQPFGQLIRTTGDADRLRYLYTGQEFDSFDGTPTNGIYNYRARLYDVASARFLTPDPSRQYPSAYIYVGDNPVSLVDPTGRFFKEFLYLLGASAAALAAGVAAGLLAPIELPGALLIFGGYAVGSIIGGSYAIATGVQGAEVAEYAVSWGLAGATAMVGLEVGGLLGMSRTAIALNEFFGVVNAFSIMPSDAGGGSYGYYVAAGLVLSFAAEGVGNVAAARYGGLRLGVQGGVSAVETAIADSVSVGAVQRGVAGLVSGFTVAGAGGIAQGKSAGETAFLAVKGGLVYGFASAISSTFEGRDAVYPTIHAYGQKALRIGVKQVVVMGSDPDITESRLRSFETYVLPVLRRYL